MRNRKGPQSIRAMQAAEVEEAIAQLTLLQSSAFRLLTMPMRCFSLLPHRVRGSAVLWCPLPLTKSISAPAGRGKHSTMQALRRAIVDQLDVCAA